MCFPTFNPSPSWVIFAFLISTGFIEFKAYQWLRATALTRFSLGDSRSTKLEDADAEGSWQTRKDAEVALRNYLNDLPSGYFFPVPCPDSWPMVNVVDFEYDCEI